MLKVLKRSTIDILRAERKWDNVIYLEEEEYQRITATNRKIITNILDTISTGSVITLNGIV